MPSFENQGFKDSTPSYRTCNSGPPAGPYSQSQDPPGYQASAYHGAPNGGRLNSHDQRVTTNVITFQPDPSIVTVSLERPPDYVCPAILVCLFCSCPTGFLALCYAVRAHNFAKEGNWAESVKMSWIARSLIITSVIIGIIAIICLIVMLSK